MRLQRLCRSVFLFYIFLSVLCADGFANHLSILRCRHFGILVSVSSGYEGASRLAPKLSPFVRPDGCLRNVILCIF